MRKVGWLSILMMTRFWIHDLSGLIAAGFPAALEPSCLGGRAGVILNASDRGSLSLVMRKFFSDPDPKTIYSGYPGRSDQIRLIKFRCLRSQMGRWALSCSTPTASPYFRSGPQFSDPELRIGYSGDPTRSNQIRPTGFCRLGSPRDAVVEHLRQKSIPAIPSIQCVRTPAKKFTQREFSETVPPFVCSP